MGLGFPCRGLIPVIYRGIWQGSRNFEQSQLSDVFCKMGWLDFMTLSFHSLMHNTTHNSVGPLTSARVQFLEPLKIQQNEDTETCSLGLISELYQSWVPIGLGEFSEAGGNRNLLLGPKWPFWGLQRRMQLHAAFPGFKKSSRPNRSSAPVMFGESRQELGGGGEQIHG